MVVIAKNSSKTFEILFHIKINEVMSKKDIKCIILIKKKKTMGEREQKVNITLILYTFMQLGLFL